MSKFIAKFYILFIIVSFSKLNAQVNFLWEKRYTSSGNNQDYGKAIAVDASGNVYVTGTAWDNSTSSYNIVTIKYNAFGVQQWIHSYNGTANGIDEGRDIVVDANGFVYVTGYTTNTSSSADFITLKLDNNGNLVWSKTYNGSGNQFDEAYALFVDGAGNVYVTGTAYMGSTPQNDIVTIKYNSSGNVLWTATHNGNNGNDAGLDITVDASGNVYVCGYRFTSGQDLNMVTIKYNSSGSQQWMAQYNSAANLFDIAKKIALDASGNVYVTGSGYGGLLYDNDVVTIKYSNSGTQLWAKRYDGPANEEDNGYDLKVDANGNVFVAGRSFGINNEGYNWLVIRYDPNGNIVWKDEYNGPGGAYDEANSLELSSTGFLYVTGYSVGNGTNNDYLTIKYDTSSNIHLWEARFNGPANNSDQAYAMAIDNNEYIYVTGTSKDPSSGQDYSTIKWCQFEVDAGPSTLAICAGDSIQLNAQSTGGLSYSWSPATGLSNPNIANPWAKPLTTTTYVVTSLNSAGCQDVDSITIIVNSLPNGSINTSGPTSFCQGDSVVLYTNATGNITWLPGNQNTTSITVYNSGTYTLMVTDSNNCSASSQIQVTVYPLPNVNAGSDTSVCKGYQVQLNASGAVNYSWNNSSTLSNPNIPNPFAFPSTTTTYVVTGTDANGCSNSDTVKVTVNPTPKSHFLITDDTVIISINPNVGFLNMSSGYTSFLWNFGDGNTSTQMNPNHPYTSPGIYTAQLITYNNNCTDTADTTIYVFQYPLSVKNLQNNMSFNLFPVPVNDVLNIELPYNLPNNATIRIYSMDGKLTKSFNLLPSNTKTFPIELKNMPPGLYLLEFTDKETLYRKSFLKQ
ncbi:MAG: hypothetical protein KatS3mg028_1504 [Bacteroidia bacterium]|nr:MAG: hypothetical protein KatS3mg028_1504 [Bacteroidia bacterium]